MEGSFFKHSPLALFVAFQLFTNLSASIPSDTNIEYIKSSCSATIYRRLCYNSLSIYASKINTNPNLLAKAALNITLKASKSTSKMMIKMSKVPGLVSKETAAAMADCVEVIGDSINEIQQSMEEMGSIRNSNFLITMSDVQTWVSAALTDEDTCMEGFDEVRDINGSLRSMIRRRIVKVSHLTSNALALINSYASYHPASP